jgi:hypothetical protein
MNKAKLCKLYDRVLGGRSERKYFAMEDHVLACDASGGQMVCSVESFYSGDNYDICRLIAALLNFTHAVAAKHAAEEQIRLEVLATEMLSEVIENRRVGNARHN